MRPATRFAILTDFDAVENYVPGEETFGPLHVNRGPVGDAPVPVSSDGYRYGRSRMRIRRANVGPFQAVDGHDAPVFHGRVSLSYVPGVDATPDPAASWDSDSWFTVEGDNVPWSQIFQAPENATSFAGHAGPLLVAGRVPLPEPLAPRIATAVGLPAGLAPLADGVYLPTATMATGYVEGAAVAGGIYVRGTVEILRAAVKGSVSYYSFQVGYPQDAFRIYVVRADRAAGTVQVVALPSNQALPGQDLEAVFQLPSQPKGDLASWAVGGADTLKLGFTGQLSGLIAVDRNKDDTSARPRTGHILALGDPTAGAKQALGGAADALPPELRTAEVFSSAGGPGAPTGLTIWAAGSIFIQNHLVVDGLGQGATTDAYVQSLTTPRGQDRLAVWADGQVEMGLAAPGAASAKPADVGVVVTASLIGLTDPLQAAAARDHQPFPRSDEGTQGYFGSIGTEGLLPYYNQEEDFGIGVGPGGAKAYRHDGGLGAIRFPTNPVYELVGDQDLLSFANNPNGLRSRGRFVLCGSQIQARRGIFTKGDTSYRKTVLYDARLGDLPPPLVP